MITLHLYKKQHQMPEEWNELTGRQLVEIASVLHKKDKSMHDRIHLFRICAGITQSALLNYNYLPSWIHQKLFWKKIEVLLFIERHLYLVDFLCKENGLTRQLIDFIGEFDGPKSNFENLLMDEFCWSEHWYLQFKSTGSIEALVSLVATLYRPPRINYDHKCNPEGDSRVPYNVHMTEHYAKHLRKQPIALLLAVMIWYEGCRQELVKSFPRVFNGKGGDTESFGLFSLITGVAEDGVLGDFDKVNSKHVQVVLLRLTELLIRAEEMKKEYEKMKP